MDVNGINETLKNHKCLTCDNLDYWDWYMCKLEKHTTEKGFLCMEPLRNCDKYVKRVGERDNCKGKECAFWCLECPYYTK